MIHKTSFPGVSRPKCALYVLWPSAMLLSVAGVMDSRLDEAFLAAKSLQPAYNQTPRYLLIRSDTDLLSAVIAVAYVGCMGCTKVSMDDVSLGKKG